MSLKCVLVNPVELVHPPFGLMYIASVLERQGHAVSIRELPSPHVANYRNAAQGLVAYLRKEDPDIVGITCMASQCGEVRSLIGAMRDPGGIRASIIVGGVHPSFMPDEVMGWGCDYVVLNEGEETIVELTEAIQGKISICAVKGIYYRDTGGVRTTGSRLPIRDIDTIPFPAYHLIDQRRFTERKGEVRGLWLRSGWIITSRGCPSSCTFCSAHRMFGKQMRFRSLDTVFEEIRMLVVRFGIQAFAIVDDTFTVNRERVFEFSRRIRREFPGLIWNCQARVNFFSEEMARVLKESNCVQVDFGVESGSQRVLDRLRKGITIEDTIRSFQACRKVGLRTLATVMVGNPDEELEDLKKTGELLRKIRPDFSAAYFATPFPGTEMYEDAKRKGLIAGDECGWNQFVAAIELSKISKKDLESALKDFTNLSIFKSYIYNPLFLFDMFRFGVLNPGISLRVFSNVLKGDTEKAFFLLTNSSYCKR